MKKDNTVLIAIISVVGVIVAALITLLQPNIAHSLNQKTPTVNNVPHIKNPPSVVNTKINNTRTSTITKNKVAIKNPSKHKVTNLETPKSIKLKKIDILSLGLTKAKDLPNNLYIKIKNIYKNKDKLFVLNKIFQGDILIPRIDASVIIFAEITPNQNLTGIDEKTFFYLKEIKSNGEVIISNSEKEFVIKFQMKFYNKELSNRYKEQDLFNSINLKVLLQAFEFYKKT